MLIFTVSFLFGVGQLLWLPKLDLNWLYIDVLILLFGLYKFLISGLGKLNKVLMGISLGFAIALISGVKAKSHQLQMIPSDHITFIGSISNLPIHKKDKAKFAFKIENHNIKKLLVSWYGSEKQVKPGQRWKFELKLKPIHGYRNPGSFDYSKWLFRHGYDATATVKSAVLLPENSTSISSVVNNIRLEIGQLISNSFNSSRVVALIKALTIGDKSQISYKDSKLFQETGTAHLIAISGLHIGLIAFVGVLFGRLLFFLFANERFNRLNFEAILAINFAFAYALLAGLSIPTIRALIMVVVFSLAYVFKQQISRWNAWSIAMMIVLILDPLSVLDVGFWFSFGAVAVLMFAFTGRKLSSNRIIAFLKAQLIILVGLLPLMVIVFQKVNLLTPFANILVLPLASLLLIPLVFASFFVYLFSMPMAGYLFVVIEELALFMFVILDYIQQFSFLNLKIQNVSWVSLVLLVLAMSTLLLPKLFRWRYISLLILLPLFVKKTSNIDNNEFNVNVLDVGQGLAVVVTTKEHSLIYDTGAKFDSGFNLASTVVIPYLQSQGVDVIDKIILSHNDNDHAGGIAELKEEYPKAEVLGVSTGYKKCTFPSSWKWNGVDFKILSPYTTQPYLGNNSSCVLKISNDNNSILLTGDIEEPIEYRLIKNFSEQIKSDVMLVPHHGSKSSSSQNFIQLVNPKIAVNSSGFANHFNHPHPLIKKRYLDGGIMFFDTQDLGMVEINFNSNGYSTNSYVNLDQHFWHPNI